MPYLLIAPTQTLNLDRVPLSKEVAYIFLWTLNKPRKMKKKKQHYFTDFKRAKPLVITYRYDLILPSLTESVAF